MSTTVAQAGRARVVAVSLEGGDVVNASVRNVR